MPSTFTTSLRQELQATGENETTWGEKVNRNFSEVLEQAIAGIATITMTNADYELSVAFGAEDEARSAIIIASGSLSTQRNVIVPAVPKIYTIQNLTSGNQSIIIKTRDGQGVTIANGEVGIVFCNGANVISAAQATADGSLVPSKISTSSSEWKVNGSFGVNVAVANESTIGKFGVNGTAGAQYLLYLNGTMQSAMYVDTNYFTIESGKPIRFILNGSNYVQINTNGSVAFASSITSVGVSSTTSISANTSIQCGTSMAVGTDLTVGGTSTFTGAATFSSTTAHTGAATFGSTVSITGATTAAAITCTTLTASSNISLSSDERLKHKWLDYPSDLVQRLANVKAGSYALKSSGARGMRFVGIGAQSLQDAWQEAVDKSDPSELKVKMPFLSVAVVALSKKMMELEARLAEVEGK